MPCLVTWSSHRYFYPRPPRGGRRLAKIIGHALNAISIHALREEGDLLGIRHLGMDEKFLSTPSARRATCAAIKEAIERFISIHALREEGDSDRGVFDEDVHDISIHALREEGDEKGICAGTFFDNFYPRPPRGGRPRMFRSILYPP